MSDNREMQELDQIAKDILNTNRALIEDFKNSYIYQSPGVLK